MRVDVLADAGRDGEAEAENVDNKSGEFEALKGGGKFDECAVKRTPDR